MSIEIGSKWIKDGEVVEVKQVSEILNDNLYYSVIWFSSLTENYKKILTKRDFLEQYKHFEPVYEYRFMYQLNGINFGEWHLHPAFYRTVEDCINYTTRDAYNFKRLDFTKRERKQ